VGILIEPEKERESGEQLWGVAQGGGPVFKGQARNGEKAGCSAKKQHGLCV